VNTVERFVSSIRPSRKGCWQWAGSSFRSGYGRFWTRGRAARAHRIAWELFTGQSLGNKHCLHTCDNPGCVNPKHLFLGSPKDNAEDREGKGRGNHGRGSEANAAKLTEKQVKEIRALWPGMSRTKIARKFGISRGNVSWILSRVTWTHI
jgi:hypothetical protein